MWHKRQCFGSASIIMQIRIWDTKNVHMDPDPDPRGVNTKEEKLHQKLFNYIFQKDIKKSLKN